MARRLDPNAPHRGRTFVQHALSDGLAARFADFGKLNDLARHEQVDLLLAHVGYDRGEPEADLAYHSPMISFSTNEMTAMGFANRPGKTLCACSPAQATHFIWKFTPALVPKLGFKGTILPGVYEYRYRENHENVLAILEEHLHDGLRSWADGGAFPVKQIAAEMVVRSANNDMHAALVFDVATVASSRLVDGKDARLVENARVRGQRDNEWLVLPCDLMPDGLQPVSRLRMNEDLFLHASLCSPGEPKL